MAIVLFILIAGLWAAFLLPSFFDHRNQTPKSTTKDFARTKQLLAAVSSARPDSEAYVRHHAQVKRTRTLLGLGIAAALTLGVATWTGSVPWLWLTIALDIAFAGYVTVLLTIKQQGTMPRASVLPIPATEVAGPALSPLESWVEPAPYEESKTVRVIAG